MAKKSIKGITIEINGDATRLDKALRDVNGTLRDTQSDLNAVNRALKLDPTNIVMLEQKEKLLAAAAEESRKKHEILKEALAQAGRSGKATAEELDALTRETEQAAIQASEAAKAAEKFSPALEQVAAKADKASEAAGKFAETTKGISIAGAAVVGSLGAMAVKAAGAADDIATLSANTGFSVEFIQEMQFASERVDVSVETMTGAMTKLKKSMDSDSASVSEAFRSIGVNVRQLEASGASMDEIFMTVVSALGNVDSELQRDQIALELFGRSADQLAGILDDGGENLRMYGQEAQDLGLVLNEDAMQGALAFQDAMDRLGAMTDASLTKAGAALIEKLMPAIEWFLGAAERVLTFLAELPSSVLVVIGVVGAIVALISPIASLVHNITGAISGVSAVGELFGQTAGNSVFLTFAKWAGIIVVVVAAITALVAAIGALTGKGQEITDTFDALSGATVGSSTEIAKVSSIQGFATGGVFEPNTPMLIGVGDNKTEREVLAPRSELVSAYGEAMQRYGGSSRTVAVSVNFEGDLAQLGKVLRPTVAAATSRRGKVV
ncbi:MAG: hypothetical protein IJD20_00860 [Oscillospiraceae bacterium]|nr:hypothetical protein [Oscillospiraceae bacterium]